MAVSAASDKVEDIYPLSPLQEGLLYHHERHPGDGAYWNRLSFKLHGVVEEYTLKQAWQSLVDRYAVLRTRFIRDRKGRPFQAVMRRAEIPWRSIDLSDLSEQDQTQRICDSLTTSTRALDSCPLLQVALFRTGTDTATLVVEYHHIILDGWSESLLLRELIANYDAARLGQASEAHQPVPFAIYIAWHKRQDRVTAERFWRDQFAGYEPQEPLPLSRALSVEPGHNQLVTTRIGEPESDAIRAFARSHGLTLNTLLQSTWALVWAAEQGQPDVVLGTVITNRPGTIQQVENQVGLYLAAAPVRYQTVTPLTLVDWFRNAQGRMSAIEQACCLSLGDIQRAAGIPMDLPLTNCLFGFDSGSADQPEPESFSIVAAERSGRTEYPFSIVVYPDEDIRIEADFDTTLYSIEWTRRALDRFKTLLRCVLSNPRQLVASLNWLTEEEQARARARRLSANRESPLPPPVDQWIARIAEQSPDVPALLCESRELSYAELQRRVRRISILLHKALPQISPTVGVCMARDPDLVAVMLAIWHLGGTYVPFDPDHPAERNRKAAETLSPDIILASPTTADAASLLGEVLVIDEFIVANAAHSDLPSQSHPDQTAYVIFTSGSTGVPNGVPIRHSALTNLLSSLIQTPGFKPADRLLAITTVAFDISLVELLLPLTAGGTLCLAPAGTAANPVRFGQALESFSISVQFATPATWELLMLSNWQGRSGLRAWCGGERLRQDLASKLLDHTDELWNLYGPTETTICSTLGQVGPDAETISIGTPVANTVVQVVDSALRILPDGVPGELCIGGAGVSEGYVGNQTLTAQRFVELPQASAPGTYFRTGDLVTLLPDGRLLHHGRTDRQLKLRGYRLDPGEIEAVLNSLDEIAGACVVLKTLDGDAQLLAYCMPAPDLEGGILETPTIRQKLEALLPDYMLPRQLIPIAELPLTTNGKVDYERLPQPEPAQAAPGHAPLDKLPQTATEKIVATVWEELLGFEGICCSDTFLELGGHSLLMMRAIRHLQEQTGVMVPPEEFLTRSLSGIAQMIDRAGSESDGRNPGPSSKRTGAFTSLVRHLLPRRFR